MSAQSMPLEAHDVALTLGGASVLHGVTVGVDAGELLALVGPNGAGKSSLLAVLSGDRRPAAGTVRLAGRPLHDWSHRARALHRAMLPQQSTLRFPFTVREVVTMGRAPWAGTPSADDDEAVVAEELERQELTALAERPFTALSGGEQGRVALARVLAQRTPVLLLDEPTAALDLRHQELVLRTARERAQAGVAVVVVLHDLSLAAAYADRVVLLGEGRVRADGPPDAVMSPELLTDVYRQRVRVVPHPATGTPLVVADR